MEPVKVTNWNVAFMAGSLMLSAMDFMVEFSPKGVEEIINCLNSEKAVTVFDGNSNPVEVQRSDEFIILKRDGDKSYPDGIMVPISAISEPENGTISEAKQVHRKMFFFRSKFNRICHGERQPVASSPSKKMFVQAITAQFEKQPTTMKVTRLS